LSSSDLPQASTASVYLFFIVFISYVFSRWSNLCVSALELQAPLTVTPSVTLQETLDLLNKEGFDQVPVVGESG
jgi:CBS domain-containing protein